MATSSTNISESLLKAIGIVADKTAASAGTDKTVKAIIKKCVSAATGQYMVTYNSGNFNATTANGVTTNFSIGDEVYVLVPEGDMSNKKLILGKATEEENSDEKIVTSSLLTDYNIVGVNPVINKTYSQSNGLAQKHTLPLDLNSKHISSYYYLYLRDELKLSEDMIVSIPSDFDTVTYPILDIDEDAFINCAKNAEALLIRAKFKANIESTSIGNYGIIVNVVFYDDTNPILDEDDNIVTDENGNPTYHEKKIAYILDANNMTGNPAKYYDYISQYTLNEFDGANYCCIESIIAFSEGYVTTDIAGDGTGDIFINDLEILALDSIEAINGDYRLKMTTPSGNTVQSGSSAQLKINAQMCYQDNDISKESLFYWAVKDPSITSLSDNYNAKVGSGYRYLSAYGTSNSEITIDSSDITAAEMIYRCVGIYNNNIILKADVSLFNNNNKLDIEITSNKGTQFQFSEGTPTLTCTINGNSSNFSDKYDDSAFIFTWSKEDAENGNILLNMTADEIETAKQEELTECQSSSDGKSSAGRTAMQVLSYYSTRAAQVQNVTFNGNQLTCSLRSVNSTITYACSVYCSGNYIGYGSITLQNSTEITNHSYYIVISNGNQAFQYTEAGVSPASDKLTNPIEVLDLTAIFYNPDGEQIIPKQVQWVVPTENTLIDIPSLGLETDSATGEKRFTGTTYPLAIKDTYDSSATNNQVTAIVTHASGDEYRQVSNLLFTKIGDNGTNGTDTLLKIEEILSPASDEYLTIIKNKDADGVWNVYKDEINGEHYPLKQDNNITSVLGGQIYTNNTKVDGFSIKWSPAGSSKVASSNYYVSTDSSDSTCGIRYTESTDTNVDDKDIRIVAAEASYAGKYYYNYYPIPAIEYQNDAYTYTNYPVKILRNGTLRNILYDLDGTNPSFNESLGVSLDLGSWTPTIVWKAESGIQTDGVYQNPNFLLSKTSKSKTGSKTLTSEDTDSTKIVDFRNEMSGYADQAKAVGDNSSANIINTLLSDIEKIIADDVIQTETKMTNLNNKITTFSSGSDNQYIKFAEHTALNLYDEMQEECDVISAKNQKALAAYTIIQNAWKNEWPVIVGDAHCIKVTQGNKAVQENPTLTEILNYYSINYNNRNKDDWIDYEFEFNDDFSAAMTALKTAIENNSSGTQFSSNADQLFIDVSLMIGAYLQELVDITKTAYTENAIYDTGSDINLLETKYSGAITYWEQNINDWAALANCELTGYDLSSFIDIKSAMSEIYKYYSAIFSNAKAYNISVESELLNTYKAILQGADINLLNQIYIVPNEHFNGLYMNNNIVAELYEGDTLAAKVYVPIVMTLNTYELASLNGWDGVGLELNEDEGYILAPQIGAGAKNTKTNQFTGIVMGVLSNPEPSSDDTTSKYANTDKIGLMGYSNGRQSIFLDANTGKATFGLAADDTETDEGRIELIPGGVSKIGNWKIGNRFLYNIKNGTYEQRRDDDARGTNIYKLMVPHDKHGIMLSADKPYIHIKGMLYENENLSGIDYNDEYNSINPEDSLELRLDPNNNSLFSIVQHTAGLGDTIIDNLYFGYCPDTKATIKLLESYENNEDLTPEEEKEQGIEHSVDGNLCTENTSVGYYVYALRKENGKYVSYYEDSPINITDATIGEYPKLNCIHSLDINYSNFFKSGYNLSKIYNNDGTLLPGNTWLQQYTSETGESYIPIIAGYSTATSNIELGSDHSFTIRITGIIPEIEDTTYRSIAGAFYVTSDMTNIGEITITTPLYNLTSSQISLSSNDNDCFRFMIKKLTNTGGTNYSVIEGIYGVSDWINIGEYSNIQIVIPITKTLEEGYYGLFCSLKHGEKQSVIFDYTVNGISVDSGECVPTDSTYVAIGSYQSTSTYSLSDSNIVTYDFISTTTYQKKIRFYLSNATSTEYDIILYDKTTGQIIGCGRTGYNNFIELNTELTQLSTTYKVALYTKNKYVNDVTKTVTYTPKGQTTPVTTTVAGYELKGGISFKEITTTTWTGQIPKAQQTINLTIGVEWSSFVNNDKVKIYKPKAESSDYYCSLDTEDGLGFQAEVLAETIPTYTTNEDGIIKISNQIRMFDTYYKKYTPNDQYAYIVLDTDNNGDQKTFYRYVKTIEKSNCNNIFIGNIDSRYYKDEPKIITYENDKGEEVEPSSTGTTFRTNAEDAVLLDEVYWKEFIRVGIDENGRFFTNSASNKKTYSRIGKLNVFNKVADAYGQEIRTQIQNASSTMTPVIKMFTITTSETDANTTYITAGKKESNNISIRSSDTGFVELGASKNNNNDDTSNPTIPTLKTNLKISYKNGIEGYTDNNQNQSSFIMNGNKTTIETPNLTLITSRDTDKNINSSFIQNINGTEILSSSIGIASKDIDLKWSSIPTENNYKIFANDNGIKLQTHLSNLIITDTKQTLEVGDYSSLVLDGNTNKIVLSQSNNESKTSYLQLEPQQIYTYTSDGASLKLTDVVCSVSTGGASIRLGTNIDINTPYNINCNAPVKGSSSLSANGSVYGLNNIYAGMNSDGLEQWGTVVITNGSGGHHFINYDTVRMLMRSADWQWTGSNSINILAVEDYYGYSGWRNY